MSDDAPATNLYQALLNAQRAMGPVLKNATNPHLRSKYADLGSVIDTIEQPLWDNGLLLVQRFQYDRIGLDGSAGEGTPILITELVHAASGERIESVIAVVSKDPTDPQKIGAAITYYRRYSLLALLGLAPEDDDGHAASQPRPQPVPARTPAPRPRLPPPAIDEDGVLLTPAPRPAPPAAAPAPAASAHIEKDLLAAIRNDLAGPDERWNALWDYYDRATDVADLNRRAEQVKASGVPDRDLRAAYKQKHSALAQLLTPVERPASYGG